MFRVPFRPESGLHFGEFVVPGEGVINDTIRLLAEELSADLVVDGQIEIGGPEIVIHVVGLEERQENPFQVRVRQRFLVDAIGFRTGDPDGVAVLEQIRRGFHGKTHVIVAGARQEERAHQGQEGKYTLHGCQSWTFCIAARIFASISSASSGLSWRSFLTASRPCASFASL